MKFFTVVKGQDAYIEYVTVIEAIDEEDARMSASSYAYEGTWIPNGIINDFDHYDIFDDRTEEVEATSFEEAVKQIHDEYDFKDVRLSPAERNTILAALRLWSDSINDGSEYLTEELITIATNGDTVAMLDDAQVDRLCQEINLG